MRTMVLSALPLVALLFGCELPADTLAFERESVPIWRAASLKPAAAAPSSLKVMAWNIKYGAGRIDFWFDFWGDRSQLSIEDVETNMDALYRLIDEYDPDILITSEIEVNSRRSAYFDMVQGILDNTRLNYAAYFSTWDSRYVPQEGLGRMDLGNAIFSKYPITGAERIRQEDRTDQGPHVSYFYIHRAIGRAVIDLGGREVAAFAVHTEAYDQDGTKQKHIAQIHQVVRAEPLPFVLGGDFNELPPLCDERVPGDCDDVLQLSGFNDERESSKGTDYEQPPYTPHVMKPLFDELTPSITLEQYGRTRTTQQRYFTHSVLGPDTVSEIDGRPGFWNRTLDYLFVRKQDAWIPGTTTVLQSPGDLGIRSDPMRLSDHAPTVGTWRVTQ